MPITLRRSLESVVFEQVVLDHLVRRHSGLDLKKARVAVLRGDTIQEPGRHDRAALAATAGRTISHLFELSPERIDDCRFCRGHTAIRAGSAVGLSSSLEAFLRLGFEPLKERGWRG